MTQVERLADFGAHSSFDVLRPDAREQLKIRILDSLGYALGALNCALQTRSDSEFGGL